MPLVANTALPSFERLRRQGETVISDEQARRQDIRELHIGLLNMMPDKALAATERQFLRLIGASNQIAQFYMHPFTLPEVERAPEFSEYVDKYYQNFDEIKEHGLDALIITGANVSGPELSAQPFMLPLNKIIDWACDNITSTLCSCLATHAVLEFRYQQKRQALPSKRWGIYSHRLTEKNHPLVTGVNTRFNAPHSRFNDISKHQFDSAGLKILAESDEAGVHLAVSEDGFRIVFFQGHPEYDTISLLKEYKREIGRYIKNEIKPYPPFPEHYFPLRTRAILEEFRDRVEAAKAAGADAAPEFPEALITPTLDNTWQDSAKALINNWIGRVYQCIHPEKTVSGGGQTGTAPGG